MPKTKEEFKEIAHCGGQYNITIKTDASGERTIQFGWSHSRPTAASVFAIYALPQGFPVGTMHIGGIGAPSNPAPTDDSLTIFISSDTHGMFGHQCSSCDGYWRSCGAPSLWAMTCPYCSVRAETHHFRTDGQKKYIKECCDQIQKSLCADEDGEYSVSMDEVVDAIGKDHKKPSFYYAEESQQNKYKCQACDDINDVLGRYAFCSTCGTHNGLQELEQELQNIKKNVLEGGPYESCVKDAVSAFDSYCRQIAKMLVNNIPMTPARKKQWGKKLFHNLKKCAGDLENVFDIKPLKNLKSEDVEFAALMFHRRHIYEHNGGEADDKYIADSGDNSVRPKQTIRETSESANKILAIVSKMATNIHRDFHLIIPPVKGH